MAHEFVLNAYACLFMSIFANEIKKADMRINAADTEHGVISKN